MYGWKGAILKIDLSSQSWEVLHPSIEIYRDFIGGRGLAGYYLRPYMAQPWHHSEMPLIFMTGPLVDTAAPTSGRMCIMSKSPLTGAICDTSVGGRLATQIKRSGYDGIILTGKSESHTGISICNNSVEFISIEEMKGKTTEEISALLPDSGSTAFAGPAAYNGVRFASIAVDSHFFSGRGGLGLVMAEKRVAYLSVQGNEKTEISDKTILKESREQIMRLTAASPILEGELGIGNFGTGTLYDLTSSRHMMPTENFKETFFNSHDKCNAVKMHEKYKPKKTGCAGCHILCKQKVSSGDFLPEFETLSHFSALLDNSNLETIFEANRLCNHYGMDTITTAVTLAAFAEIEKKKLTPEEILDIITSIATTKGIGKELKLGSLHYARKQNQEESSMTVKGLELPAYDPRGAYGMALAYATSTRGGCHLRAYPISHEILRKPAATDRFSFSGKARIIKINEDANAVIDSLTACKFIFFGATLEEYARALEGVTGVHYTAQELLSIGHKIIYNEHIMNETAGLDGTSDTLPQRFFTQKGSNAEDFEVPPIDKKEFQNTLMKYYKIRKLSDKGLPIPEEVKKLGL